MGILGHALVLVKEILMEKERLRVLSTHAMIGMPATWKRAKRIWGIYLVHAMDPVHVKVQVQSGISSHPAMETLLVMSLDAMEQLETSLNPAMDSMHVKMLLFQEWSNPL